MPRHVFKLTAVYVCFFNVFLDGNKKKATTVIQSGREHKYRPKYLLCDTMVKMIESNEVK